jgi:hypothetical protein
MKELTRLVMDFARCQGACAVGIATTETLSGGPPSVDLTGVLSDAKAAISFAFPLNQELIAPFLTKKDRRSHEKDNIDTNGLAGGLSLQLSKWLDQKGYPSLPQAPNDVYRQDSPGGVLDMVPEKDEDFLPAIIQGVKTYGQRPEIAGGYHHSLMPGTKLWLTCGNCQLICHPDKAVRQERYDMLRKSGVVIQEQDGSLTAVSAQEAAAHFTAMDASTRSLYMDVHDP